MKIENRTFIVSGGSSGLGLATVRDLLQANAYVAILDRATPPTFDDIAADASHLMYAEMDITKVSEVENAIERTITWTKSTGAALGGIINAAGIALAATLLNHKGEPHPTRIWERVLAVNLTGTFHLTRLAVKHLACVPPEEGPDGERGVVIMISSTVAYEGQLGQIAYAASKGAIRSMTLPMARDLSRYGIRVATIAPGPFKTPMTGQFSDKVKQGLEKSAMLHPRRFGAPSEFASAVRWVLECAYVNGETIKLTGGARVPALL